MQIRSYPAWNLLCCLTWFTLNLYPIIATFFKTLLFRFQFSIICLRSPKCKPPCFHLWGLQSEKFHPTYTYLIPKVSWSVTIYDTLGHKCTEHSTLIYQTSKDCTLNPAVAIHFSRCICLCLNLTAYIHVAELLRAEALEPQQSEDVFIRIFTQLDASVPVKLPPRVHLPSIKTTYCYLLLDQHYSDPSIVLFMYVICDVMSCPSIFSGLQILSILADFNNGWINSKIYDNELKLALETVTGGSRSELWHSTFKYTTGGSDTSPHASWSVCVTLLNQVAILDFIAEHCPFSPMCARAPTRLFSNAPNRINVWAAGPQTLDVLFWRPFSTTVHPKDLWWQPLLFGTVKHSSAFWKENENITNHIFLY